MKLSSFISLLSFHFLFLSSHAAAPLDHLCAGLRDYYISQNYCIRTLGAIPKSRTANYQGLGVIAVNLTIVDALAMDLAMESLLLPSNASRLRPEEVRALEACVHLFGREIVLLRQSARSIAAKRYVAARIALLQAIYQGLSCTLRPDFLPSITGAFEFLDLMALAAGVVSYLEDYF